MIRPPDRTKSGKPKRLSSCATYLLIAGWETRSLRAAAEIEYSCITTRNISISRILIAAIYNQFGMGLGELCILQN